MTAPPGTRPCHPCNSRPDCILDGDNTLAFVCKCTYPKSTELIRFRVPDRFKKDDIVALRDAWNQDQEDYLREDYARRMRQVPLDT